MSKLVINLEEKYSRKLGVGPTAKKLFDEIQQESAVILNNAVDQGYEYLISYPYANVENSKKNLVAVDYLQKKV